MFSAPLVCSLSVYELVRNIAFIIILCIASTPLPHKIYLKFKENKIFKAIIFVLSIALIFVCTAYIVDSSYNPFLYFRF
jgi:alginate O-acetyltransferase complex protein AlgI